MDIKKMVRICLMGGCVLLGLLAFSGCAAVPVQHHEPTPTQPVLQISTTSTTKPENTQAPTWTPTVAVPTQLAATADPTSQNNSEKLFQIDPQALSGLPPAYYLMYQGPDDHGALHLISTDQTMDRKIGEVTGFVDPVSLDGKILSARDKTVFEIMNLEKMEVRRIDLTQFFSGYEVNNLAVSPNVKWIACDCLGPHMRFLVLKSLIDDRSYTLQGEREGGNPDGMIEDFLSLSWSFDGSWIAYYRLISSIPIDANIQRSELMLLDTSCLELPGPCELKRVGPFRLKGRGLYGEGPHTWSPDSRQFLISLGGFQLPFVTFDILSQSFTIFDEKDTDITAYSAAWSPDGKWIAYSSEKSSDISLRSFQNNQIGKLTTNEKEIDFVDWLSTYPRPVFQVGSRLFITGAGDNLNVRATPNGAKVGELHSGDFIQITDGPQEVDGSRWWKVKAEKGGLEGWCMENPDWYSGIQ